MFLRLFRQAVAVMIMPALVCADPSVTAEVAPQLKPEVVLELLSKLKPDKLNPVQVKADGFAKHFQVKGVGDQELVQPSFECNFGGLVEFLTGEWRRARVGAESIAKFEYLKIFAADNED
jgi:hypothetical protein